MTHLSTLERRHAAVLDDRDDARRRRAAAEDLIEDVLVAYQAGRGCSRSTAVEELRRGHLGSAHSRIYQSCRRVLMDPRVRQRPPGPQALRASSKRSRATRHSRP